MTYWSLVGCDSSLQGTTLSQGLYMTYRSLGGCDSSLQGTTCHRAYIWPTGPWMVGTAHYKVQPVTGPLHQGRDSSLQTTTCHRASTWPKGPWVAGTAHYKVVKRSSGHVVWSEGHSGGPQVNQLLSWGPTGTSAVHPAFSANNWPALCYVCPHSNQTAYMMTSAKFVDGPGWVKLKLKNGPSSHCHPICPDISHFWHLSPQMCFIDSMNYDISCTINNHKQPLAIITTIISLKVKYRNWTFFQTAALDDACKLLVRVKFMAASLLVNRGLLRGKYLEAWLNFALSAVMVW